MKNRITDHIITILSKMCLAQDKKNIGFGDIHFARYIMQIHQVCEAVGQMTGSKRDDVGSAAAEVELPR